MKNKRHHTDHKAFFDDPVVMQRYDIVRHKWVEGFNNTQLSFFWRPEEVDVSKDKTDFQKMSKAAQFIFTSNLQRQILLDTKQGKDPISVFLPLASSPEMEAACVIWPFSELIHSRSYTHIIRGVYNNPSEVFDEVLGIEPIVELYNDLDKYYKDAEDLNFYREAKARGLDVQYSEREHKKAVYLAFISANVLEAIRFFVSFACSFAMMELDNKMEGNAKIIKLISRDEALHKTFVQRIISRVIKEDEEWQEIVEESKEEALGILLAAVKQEKDWAKYLFQHGDMLGLNEQICCQYVDYIAKPCATQLGLTYPHDTPDKNPLPWMDSWLSSASKQTALQEAENDSYLIGIVGGSHEDARKEMLKIMEEFNV